MTSEPKFVPEEAVEISPDGTAKLRIRMIDSVGYMIPEEVYNEVCEKKEDLSAEDICKLLIDAAVQSYLKKEEECGEEVLREIERISLLYAVDKNWMEHIDTIDQLRYSIGLRSIGHHDPVVEYKFEAFEMFDEMNKTIQSEALRLVFMARVKNGELLQRRNVAVSSKEGANPRRGIAAQPNSAVAEARAARGENISDERSRGANNTTTFKRDSAKVGRNDKCPCGSGKKYKNCCGINDED
jgi:preprotein translocase subunit SecA